jgi:hypothetical protein
MTTCSIGAPAKGVLNQRLTTANNSATILATRH